MKMTFEGILGASGFGPSDSAIVFLAILGVPGII
jgi:hypothetical protein